MSSFLEQLVSSLGQSLEGLSVFSAYPEGELGAGEATLAVACSSVQEEQGGVRREAKLTLTVPLSQGAGTASGWMEQILTAGASLSGCQQAASEELRYDGRLDSFVGTVTLRFREIDRTVTLDGTPLPCFRDTLKLVSRRQEANLFSPFVGAMLQDLGKNARVVSGQGQLTAQEYQDLQELFDQGGAMTLVLSPSLSFPVTFSSMTLERMEAEGMQYRFVLTEVVEE